MRPALVAVLVLSNLAGGCATEPPAVEACHSACLRLRSCSPLHDVDACVRACDDAAPLCGDDQRIADLLNACNQSSCGAVSSCLFLGALICSPLLHALCEWAPANSGCRRL